ncbi:jg19775 [Pararge aegeria aegeria]|uniref:Jg19775 protein n=1 Tax=Pararge aegeria aegeria TaxID=348720 RepID=A0A8S4SKK7_9NEOP|nr:jg19775 [Pararge aegeria aegeria]
MGCRPAAVLESSFFARSNGKVACVHTCVLAAVAAALLEQQSCVVARVGLARRETRGRRTAVTSERRRGSSHRPRPAPLAAFRACAAAVGRAAADISTPAASRAANCYTTSPTSPYPNEQHRST